ncbi:MAG: SGNH/GDSL hydrolase family protein [Planctomycetota bacterium]
MVAIGASNLSRGLPGLTTIVRAGTGRPDFLVAAGHGRSYGANSRVAWRRLPSILRSGLWRALDRLEPTGAARPVCAVVTDIGNDLLYGFTVEQTAGWVRECLARLAEHGVRTVVTGLPLASVARAGPLRYRLLRTVYVPGCRLSLGELRSAAQRLDEAVRSIAAEHAATLIEQPGDWYGFDSIHVRRRRLGELWEAAANVWALPRPAAAPRVGLAEWARIGARAAEVRSLAGVIRYTRQPVVRWPDGGTLSMY